MAKQSSDDKSKDIYRKVKTNYKSEPLRHTNSKEESKQAERRNEGTKPEAKDNVGIDNQSRNLADTGYLYGLNMKADTFPKQNTYENDITLIQLGLSGQHELDSKAPPRAEQRIMAFNDSNIYQEERSGRDLDTKPPLQAPDFSDRTTGKLGENNTTPRTHPRYH